MKIIFASAARHLQSYFSSMSQEFISHAFSDGERYVNVSPELTSQEVWVIANTIPPAEHLIELFLLLDALQRLNCTIRLLFTYFAYARQDRALPGQALSAQVISTFLKQFAIQEISIIHVHSYALHSFLSFTSHIPYSFFLHRAAILPIDVIVAPDKGAHELVEYVSSHSNKHVAFLEKEHPSLEQTKMLSLHGDVSGKNILIVDDMISTAGTIITAAQLLHEKGAQEIYVAATHGIFADDAVQKINDSIIKKVFVTNTLNVAPESSKITVIDISAEMYEIISKK